MKKLWVLRHAKSDWGAPSLPDFERTLNARGLRNAPEMGAFLAKQATLPGHVVASPATRARQTAELVCQSMGYPVGRIQYEPRIYESSPDTLLDVIDKVSDDISHLLLVGHNPGLTMLVNMLGGVLDNLPTCSVVSMTFDSRDWALLCYPPKDVQVWRAREVLGS